MRRLILAITMLLACGLQAAELKLIQLHHRQAEELLPLVQPLLDPSDALSGSGYQLIVRTAPQRLAEIEALVRQLDTAPQQLVISVRQSGSSDSSEEHYSASGSISSGNLRIGVETPAPTARGGSITTYRNYGSGSVNAYSAERQQSSNLAQRVMVLEGHWATINVGQTVPIKRQIVTQTPYGSQVQQTTDYADATSGFEVRPRLNGSEVTLEIAPYRRKLASSSGAIDTQSVSSTARGELGEWIEIGGINESGGGSEGGIGYSGSSRSSDVRSVWLKVELAR